ncbi:hypothetical protein [Streptomyces sp. NBC_00203]|uniref:hypothetical protein n=1 Tax=Streptomyces sp. NBC_00203 TaxID=2975680 RepID=UPI003245881C
MTTSTDHRTPAAPAPTPGPIPDPDADRGWIRVRFPRGTRCVTLLGTGSLTVAITHGDVAQDPTRLWALVALNIATMAYDLTDRWLQHRPAGRT